MDPVQLVILRMGLYELVELGAPPHAISEHVDLARALVFPQAAGFTNGPPTHWIDLTYNGLFSSSLTATIRTVMGTSICVPYPSCVKSIAGVLRSAARARDAGALPAPPLPASPPPVLDAAAVDALATATSHPTWMVARWAARFGPAETLALLQANNRRAGSPANQQPLSGLTADFMFVGIRSIVFCTASCGARVFRAHHPLREAAGLTAKAA